MKCERRKTQIRRRVTPRRLSCEPLEDRRLLATLVADINQELYTQGAFPDDVIAAGDRAFFTAINEFGREWWVTDGTSAGTHMISDVTPGPDSTTVEFYATAGNHLIFVARTEVEGDRASSRLFATDGTSGEVFLLADSFYDLSGSFSGAPPILIVQDHLYFAQGSTLWRSDGTPAGTEAIASDTFIYRIVNVGETIYFSGSDSSHIARLWSWDADRGTQLLSFGARRFLPVSGDAYVTETTETDILLRRLEEDPSQITLLAALEADPVILASVAERPLLMTEMIGVEEGGQIELFSTVESSLSLASVAVIDTPYVEGPPESKILYVDNLNDQAIFLVYDVDHGIELWHSDGTAAGTGVVKDIVPGPGSSGFVEFELFDGQLYFSVDDGVHGVELWRTDGSESGTELVHDIQPGTVGAWPSGLATIGDYLYFSAETSDAGAELWRTNGTSDGLERVADVAPGATSGFPSFLTSLGEEVFFLAAGDGEDFQPWITDGAPAGAHQVTTIGGFAENESSFPRELTQVGDVVFFSADNGLLGRELWRTEGMADSTRLVRDIYTGPLGSSPTELVAFGDSLLFSAVDDTHGRELWISGGASDNTYLLADISPGPDAGDPHRFFEWNGLVYFVADDGNHGEELWVTDGTEPGTHLLRDVVPGSTSSDIDNFIVFGGELYFSAKDADNWYGLWKTDGTESGTKQVHGNLPVYDVSPQLFVVRDDWLYFVQGETIMDDDPSEVNGPVAEGAAITNAFIRTDGDDIVTYTYDAFSLPVIMVLLRDGIIGLTGVEHYTTTSLLYVGHNGSTSSLGIYTLIPTLQVVGGTAFFISRDLELWKTEGKAFESEIVRDINPGEPFSFPGSFYVAGDLLYFLATSADTGREVWVSNGTTEGTYLLGEATLGPGSSMPGEMLALGSQLLFAGTNDVYGTEIWTVDRPQSVSWDSWRKIVAEEDSTTVAKLQRHGDPVGEVRVVVNVISGSASSADYSLPESFEFTLAEGQTELQIPIELVNDSLDEFSERFELVIAQVDGAMVGVTSEIEIAIADDETRGDLSPNGRLNCSDLNNLRVLINDNTYSTRWDINVDSHIDRRDYLAWMELAADRNQNGQPYLPGDANLDGVVDATDYRLLENNLLRPVYSTSPSAYWCRGDFNFDAQIDGQDFNLWNQYKFQSTASPAPAGPARAPRAPAQVESPSLLPSALSDRQQVHRRRAIDEAVELETRALRRAVVHDRVLASEPRSDSAREFESFFRRYSLVATEPRTRMAEAEQLLLVDKVVVSTDLDSGTHKR
ncbi:MAG: hypothetical protein KDA60_07245 [Planctomycetales bacterium]|nr:hypothetical protein [Planctomycetales bacterium]